MMPLRYKPSYKAFFPKESFYCVSGIQVNQLFCNISLWSLRTLNQYIYKITDPEGYTKTLGIEWNTHMDHLRLTITALPQLQHITKYSIRKESSTTKIIRAVFDASAKSASGVSLMYQRPLISLDGFLPLSSKQRYFYSSYGSRRLTRMTGCLCQFAAYGCSGDRSSRYFQAITFLVVIIRKNPILPLFNFTVSHTPLKRHMLV